MNLSILMGWARFWYRGPSRSRSWRPSANSGPPSLPRADMDIGMLNHPNLKSTDMSCIKGAFSGSAPLPVEVIHDFEKLTGATIVEGFG